MCAVVQNKPLRGSDKHQTISGLVVRRDGSYRRFIDLSPCLSLEHSRCKQLSAFDTLIK